MKIAKSDSGAETDFGRMKVAPRRYPISTAGKEICRRSQIKMGRSRKHGVVRSVPTTVLLLARRFSPANGASSSSVIALVHPSCAAAGGVHVSRLGTWGSRASQQTSRR